MRPNQALEYLYKVTVIEPTVADEQAEKAINVLRRQLETLERLVEQIAGEARLWRNKVIRRSRS